MFTRENAIQTRFKCCLIDWKNILRPIFRMKSVVYNITGDGDDRLDQGP